MKPVHSSCDEPAPPGRPEEVNSVIDLTARWLSATKDRLGLVTRLAAAEARLAVTNLVLIIAFSTVIALMIVGTWGLICAGLVYVMSQSGAPVWVSLSGLSIMQLLIAIYLIGRTQMLGANLHFRATRRRLFPGGREADGRAG